MKKRTKFNCVGPFEMSDGIVTVKFSEKCSVASICGLKGPLYRMVPTAAVGEQEALAGHDSIPMTNPASTVD